jgi:hypothetical protein
MPDNVSLQNAITAKAARTQAAQGTTRRPRQPTACNILLDFCVGMGDVATIYMSPNPYFDVFEQPLDISTFELRNHATAGLDLYETVVGYTTCGQHT